MNQPITKYSITIKPSEETYTIKSLLRPDLSAFDLSRTSVHWFRQPPSPYELEQLPHNFNLTTYKCSSLDYECLIVCRVINGDNREVAKFQYGPIQTFVYCRLSTSLEMPVRVLLFGNWKKCIFTLGTIPTLINPQNQSKYQLTQQDILSISPTPQTQIVEQQTRKTQLEKQNIPVLNNLMRKTVVVQNLYQRLVLLKLFHEIPNDMYCHSIQVLQIAFYDESACTTALLAINRFKYQKRQLLEVTKSMYSQPTQDFGVQKSMKKSNESLSQIKTQSTSNGPVKNFSEDTLKKQFLPLSAFTNWKKSPKESINSANQSFVSGNSSKANESRTSLASKKIVLSRNVQERQNQEGKAQQSNLQQKSRVSLKQPKISILSTDINSTKQAREQKPSFPQAPPPPQNLKSSQLLIKPNEFKSTLSLRRSQQQIKTPRMDQDDQNLCVNNSKVPLSIKKKSISEIQIPKQDDQWENESKYVNQFENLLFEQGQNENTEAELCLNDSFAKLEEQEEKQNEQQSQIIQEQKPNKAQTPENILKCFSSVSPVKYETDIQYLKLALVQTLQENQKIKQKNELLRREIHQNINGGQKSKEIDKYEREIRTMKQIQGSLIRQIESLKKQALLSSSQIADNRKGHNSWMGSRLVEKEKINFSYQKNQNTDTTKNRWGEGDGNGKKEFLINKNRDSDNSNNVNKQIIGSVFSPPRQSKVGNQFLSRTPETSSPSFLVRRSQQHDQNAFAVRETQPVGQEGCRNLIFNSGDLRFIKLQQDPEYQKFRNNQSYSYKQSEPFKMEQRRPAKQFGLKY